MSRLLIIVFVLSLCGCSDRRPPVRTGLEGQPLPSISLLEADSTTVFNTGSIPAGRPFVVMSFEPWCPYCRAQTQDIVKNIKRVEGIDFYLLCSAPVGELRQYCDQYGLGKYKNIHAGIDIKYTFAQYFKSAQVPYLAFYGADRKLKEVAIGKTTVARIKAILLD